MTTTAEVTVNEDVPDGKVKGHSTMEKKFGMTWVKLPCYHFSDGPIGTCVFQDFFKEVDIDYKKTCNYVKNFPLCRLPYKKVS